MRIVPNFTVLVFLVACTVLWAACAIQGAYSCDSCGRECAAACGTRHFRTCCFNYLRKRSGGPALVEGVNYHSPRLARARQEDDWWRRGGVAVYRGYLPAEDMVGAFDNKLSDNDFDLEITKPNIDGSAAIGNRGDS